MRGTCLLAAVAVPFACASFAADWPQFRGPNRDGISSEKGLLAQWPEGGPKLLWSATGVGSGYTHAVVANGLVYVTGAVGNEGVLRAYNLDGKLAWQAKYGLEWITSHPGARSIPTVHDGLLYVASGIGDLACLDAATGKTAWTLPLFEKYEAPQVKWGYAESLLVDGDNVIATPCGAKATMVALNRKTGEQAWASAPLGQLSSFCSPLLVTHNKTRMIVTMLDQGIMAFSPEDGKVLWQHAYRNFRGNHPITPICSDGLLYVTSGYGQGAIGLKLADDGKSVTQIWEQPRQDPVHGQAVLVDGWVYAGSHQKANGKWSSVELKTGKQGWEDTCVGNGGSVICADGMLYCYSESGTVGLVRPSPEKCQVVSSFKVTAGEGPHWAHPTVAHNRLFIRHGDALLCYDIAAR
jgi:outer membrane protein assembly factor BamB